MNYKFDWLNDSLTIENPTVTWVAAGFSRGDVPSVTVDIELTTESSKFNVQLSINKEANDRSDAAIDALTLLLLEPYQV